MTLESHGRDNWVYLTYAEHGTGGQYDSTGAAVARARVVTGSLPARRASRLRH